MPYQRVSTGTTVKMANEDYWVRLKDHLSLADALVMSGQPRTSQTTPLILARVIEDWNLTDTDDQPIDFVWASTPSRQADGTVVYPLAAILEMPDSLKIMEAAGPLLESMMKPSPAGDLPLGSTSTNGSRTPARTRPRASNS